MCAHGEVSVAVDQFLQSSYRAVGMLYDVIQVFTSKHPSRHLMIDHEGGRALIDRYI